MYKRLQFELTPEQSTLVGDNIRLVYSFAQRHRFPPIPNEEIISDLYMAICRAAWTFDASKANFSTYAFNGMHLRRRQMWKEYEKLKKRPKKISIDRTFNKNDDGNWLSLLAQEDQEDTTNEDKEFIHHHMKGLSLRHQMILRWWMKGNSKKAIARKLEVSTQRIDQIINYCITKMQKSVEESPVWN